MIAYDIPNEPKVYEIYETNSNVNYTVEKYLCNSVRLKPWVTFLFSLELVSTVRKNGMSAVKTYILANMPYDYFEVDLSTFVR